MLNFCEFVDWIFWVKFWGVCENCFFDELIVGIK